MQLDRNVEARDVDSDVGAYVARSRRAYANASEMGLVLEVLAEPSPELVQGHPAPVPVVEELVLQPPVEALGCVPNVVARSPERGCGDRLCDDLPKAHAENGFLDRCLMRLRGAGSVLTGLSSSIQLALALATSSLSVVLRVAMLTHETEDSAQYR